ncbi:Chromosome partitioning related protein, partial [Pseudomonas ficuserectae]
TKNGGSPLQPNILNACEFNRGTLQMLDGLHPYSRLGLNIADQSGGELP